MARVGSSRAENEKSMRIFPFFTKGFEKVAVNTCSASAIALKPRSPILLDRTSIDTRPVFTRSICARISAWKSRCQGEGGDGDTRLSRSTSRSGDLVGGQRSY